jgi:hypothetical protein
MRVQFVRGDLGTGYVVLILREDGVTVRLPGYDRTFRVPHDLAHFVTEREFHLSGGVFGCIAAGAMFSNMSIVDGRARYDANARTRAILKANGAELSVAEVLSGVVHDAVEHRHEFPAAYRRLRESWGILRPEPCPYQPAELRKALDVLTGLGARWRAVEPGGTLALRWDAPGAPTRRAATRGRRGADVPA